MNQALALADWKGFDARAAESSAGRVLDRHPIPRVGRTAVIFEER
jgi:hypothetical protein